MDVRYGSLTSSHLSNMLASPSIELIGLSLEDICVLDFECSPQNRNNTTKLKSICERPIINKRQHHKLKMIAKQMRFRCHIDSIYIENYELYLAWKFLKMQDIFCLPLSIYAICPIMILLDTSFRLSFSALTAAFVSISAVCLKDHLINGPVRYFAY